VFSHAEKVTRIAFLTRLRRPIWLSLAFRFYALYDMVYRADILAHAYRLVFANKGGAGVDGITFEAIESGEGVTAFLAELEEGACPAVKNIGKPYAGKPHARFDEGGLAERAMVALVRHRQTKGAANR
jgi:hypothetical protein